MPNLSVDCYSNAHIDNKNYSSELSNGLWVEDMKLDNGLCTNSQVEVEDFDEVAWRTKSKALLLGWRTTNHHLI
ncbi:hypothetical protein OH492_13900 [Vibrio chagasii]|nr:hypothetical protein [Vibrio chagasii]